MENLNAEQVKYCLELILKSGIGMSRDDVDVTDIRRALALITSQEQRIKELETENRQYYYEQRKLVEAHDTYKEYAENMQLFVEKMVHLEDKGYEPSAARYAAEMDMWRVVALEKKKLTEENERLEVQIDELCDNIACLEIDKENAESRTVRKMQEALCEGRVSNDPVVIAVNVVAKEMLEGEK